MWLEVDFDIKVLSQTHFMPTVLLLSSFLIYVVDVVSVIDIVVVYEVSGRLKRNDVKLKVVAFMILVN